VTPPLSFLLGLAILVLNTQFGNELPGQATLGSLAPFLVLVPVPWALARWNGSRLAGMLLRHRIPELALQLAVRLQALTVPAIYALLVFEGGLGDVAAALAPRSLLAQHALLLAPLIAMEVSLRLGERAATRRLELAGSASAPNIGPSRLPMTFFVLLPILAFSLVADLAFRDRRLEVFFGGTALGSSVGLLLLVFAFSLALPLFFRWTMPTSSTLPPHVAPDVLATVRALGFPERSVLSLATGHRVINAAMVGPLRWPRYLVLTDGIMSFLDREALRGVVAHEVGHARAGHPALLLVLFVCLPVLLLHPVLSIDFGGFDPLLLIALGVAIGVAAMIVVRWVWHTFEFEADARSVDALGGARPCVAALRRVGELYPLHRHKATFRHPSEDRRIAHLIAWEADPRYRARVQRRGRRLRVSIGLMVVLAIGVSAWVHGRLWAFDHATYLLYTGEFARARDALAAIEPAQPIVTEQDLVDLRAQADAALQLVPDVDAASWSDVAGPLASGAWQRAMDTFARDGPQAALPWLSLALADEGASPVERSLYLYCRAVREGDDARAASLREHLLRLGVPTELGKALDRAGR
jgi:Zn-dependent protease with chaperone function